MKYKDDFENILNDALAEFRDAEPLAGIEERVLRRVRAQASRPARAWWWLAAAPALLLLAFAVWMGLRSTPDRRPASATAQQERAPIAVSPRSTQDAGGEHAAAQITASRTRAVALQARVRKPAEPMRAQFPSPRPLDPQERALLALARTQPEALEPWVHEENTQDIAPISIQPLDQNSATGEDR